MGKTNWVDLGKTTRPIAYCRYHRSELSKVQVKHKDCIKKNCSYLVRTNKEYWKAIDAVNAKKKAYKEAKKLAKSLEKKEKEQEIHCAICGNILGSRERKYSYPVRKVGSFCCNNCYNCCVEPVLSKQRKSGIPKHLYRFALSSFDRAALKDFAKSIEIFPDMSFLDGKNVSEEELQDCQNRIDRYNENLKKQYGESEPFFLDKE